MCWPSQVIDEQPRRETWHRNTLLGPCASTSQNRRRQEAQQASARDLVATRPSGFTRARCAKEGLQGGLGADAAGSALEGFVNQLIRLLTMHQPSSRAVAAAAAHEVASSRPSDYVLQRSAARAGVELVVGLAVGHNLKGGRPTCLQLPSAAASDACLRPSIKYQHLPFLACLPAALLVRKLRITEQAPSLAADIALHI